MSYWIFQIAKVIKLYLNICFPLNVSRDIRLQNITVVTGVYEYNDLYTLGLWRLWICDIEMNGGSFFCFYIFVLLLWSYFSTFNETLKCTLEGFIFYFIFCLLKLINYCKILSLNTALPYSMSYLLSMPASGRSLRLVSSGYHWAALRHSGSPGLTTNSHKHLLPSQSTLIWKPSWPTRCWINFICPSVDLKLRLNNLNDIHWYDHCSQTLAQTHTFLDFPWHPHIVPFYLLMTTAFLLPPLFLWSLGWCSEFPQIRSILGFIHPLPHHVLIRLSGHAFSLRSLACTFQLVWQKKKTNQLDLAML